MNAKMMRAIRGFIRTVELGQMSAAAEELHMSTSAVSQQLQKLERDLGLSLFHRNTRQLTLTEAGRIHYQSCRTILKTAEKAQEEIDQLQGTPSGTLKVIAPVGFGAGLLSQPLAQLMREFPKLRVELFLSDEPPNLVATGTDLALCIGPLPDSTMVARHLVDWRLVLCAAASHPEAGKDICTPAQLNEESYIGHSVRERRFDDKLTHSRTGEALALPRPRIRVNNMQVAVQLTRDGLGYGLLPEPEVQAELQAGTLVQLLPEWQGPSYSVHALAPTRDAMPAKTRTVIEQLQHWFGKVSMELNYAAREHADPMSCTPTPR